MKVNRRRQMNTAATIAWTRLNTALTQIEKLQGLLGKEFGRGSLIDFTSDIDMLQRTRAKVNSVRTATAEPAEVNHE